MKIFLSAAESSSDQHAAFLMEAIVKESRSRGLPDPEFFGLGGPAMKARGFRVILDTHQFLVMGFVEVLSRLRRIFQALDFLESTVQKEAPAIGVVVDYPDFHFRLARRLRIPMVYYIPPKVWAWRRSRVRFLKSRFKQVISILPFEVKFLKDSGVEVSYVGNPLLDELPLLLPREQARERLGINTNTFVIVMMPGSRPGEIKYHWQVAIEGALLLARQKQKQGLDVKVLIPLAQTTPMQSIQKRLEEFCKTQNVKSELFTLLQGRAHESLLAADVGLIKSGTSTLEAALLNCPHVVFYKASWLSEWIFRLIVRYAGPVSLTNLVYGMQSKGQRLVVELLGKAASAESIYREALKITSNQNYLTQMRDGFDQIRRELMPPGQQSPSYEAAKIILDLAQAAEAKTLEY